MSRRSEKEYINEVIEPYIKYAKDFLSCILDIINFLVFIKTFKDTGYDEYKKINDISMDKLVEFINDYFDHTDHVIVPDIIKTRYRNYKNDVSQAMRISLFATELISNFEGRISDNIDTICNNILEIISNHLLPDEEQPKNDREHYQELKLLYHQTDLDLLDNVFYFVDCNNNYDCFMILKSNIAYVAQLMHNDLLFKKALKLNKLYIKISKYYDDRI